MQVFLGKKILTAEDIDILSISDNASDFFNNMLFNYSKRAVW